MIYLDHNATTPVPTEVFEAMRPYSCEEWGNPFSAYKFGSEFKGVIETAPAQVPIASLLTVNLGDDADPTGALFGQFAGGDLRLRRESPSYTGHVRRSCQLPASQRAAKINAPLHI
jgi:hypothetical protein